MTYVQGFVIPVKTAQKEAYRAMAARMAPIFLEHGAIRLVECWGDAVPHGKTTDFYSAVQAGEDETVVFSWAIYPDKATFEAAHKKVFADPRMQVEPGQPLPFDPQRMIHGCFEPILDVGAGD